MQTALVLGGVGYMLTVFGDELDATLDEQVSEVQRDLDDSFDDVRRSVREELDRRLPPPDALSAALRRPGAVLPARPCCSCVSSTITSTVVSTS